MVKADILMLGLHSQCVKRCSLSHSRGMIVCESLRQLERWTGVRGRPYDGALYAGSILKSLMTARNLLESWAFRLEAEHTRVRGTARDQPITQVACRLVRTIGTLHLYELTLPQGSSIEHDTPLSIIPTDDMEPTEGIVLGRQDNVCGLFGSSGLFCLSG